MAAKIADIDKGWRKLLKKAGLKKGLTVGIHAEEGGAAHGEGATVAEVASYQEFGTETIPERSFIRAWADENQEKNLQMGEKIFALAVARGLDPIQAVNQIGQKLVSSIQARIAAGIPPALDPKTISRKGSSTPLIDTGQLKASIRYKVE